MRNVLFLIILLFIFSCTEEEEGDPIPEFTLENELELSDLLLEEILNKPSQYGEVYTNSNSFVSNYIKRVGDSILNSGQLENRSKYEWNIFLINDTIEGKIYGVPGGKVFLSSGIILKMNGEDELAALIAREISYLDNGLTLDKILDVYGIPLTIETFSDTNLTAVPAMASIIINDPYTLENEKLGDLNSVKYLCGKSYASFALAKLYLTIENDSLQDLNRNFEFYPNSEERRNVIVDESTELGCSGNENYSSQFSVLKDSLLKI